MKYCPLCRCPLESQDIQGRTRLACSSAECHFVHWNNPVPVVAGLVLLPDGYVLARNAGWPPNVFSVLTGFLENGETPEQAVNREVQEELGVQTHGTRLIGHFPLPQLNQLIIAYELEATGTMTLSEEIAEVKVVLPGELAAFDFGPLHLTRDIVSQWLKRTPSAERNAMKQAATSLRESLGAQAGSRGRLR